MTLGAEPFAPSPHLGVAAGEGGRFRRGAQQLAPRLVLVVYDGRGRTLRFAGGRHFTHAPAPAGSPSARLPWLASIRKTVPRAWIFRGNARKRIVLRIAGTGTTHRAGRATKRRVRGSRSEPRRYATPFRRGPGSIHKEFSPQPSPANVFRASPVARYQQHAHGGTAIGRLRAHSIRRRRAQLPEGTGRAFR